MEDMQGEGASDLMQLSMHTQCQLQCPAVTVLVNLRLPCLRLYWGLGRCLPPVWTQHPIAYVIERFPPFWLLQAITQL